MRNSRRNLLSLLEQQPRTVYELAQLTKTRAKTVYQALWEFQSLGVVKSQAVPHLNDRGRPQKIFGLSHVDLSVYARAA